MNGLKRNNAAANFFYQNTWPLRNIIFFINYSCKAMGISAPDGSFRSISENVQFSNTSLISSLYVASDT